MNGDGIFGGSPEGINIGQILRDLIGVEILRGVLGTGGDDDIDVDPSTFPGGQFPFPDLPNPVDEAEREIRDRIRALQRAYRILDLLRRLSEGAEEALEDINGLKCAVGISDGQTGTPHFYAFENELCTIGGLSSPGCSTDAAWLEAKLHPAPGYLSNTVPIVDGQNGVAELGLPGGFDDGGPIRFEVNDAGRNYANVTRTGHKFHPGRVDRAVFANGNDVTISTQGTGTGACPVFNTVIGTMLFKQLDAFIECHLKWTCVTIPPKMPGHP